MPVSLANIVLNQREITVPILDGAEKLTVTYAPLALTGEVEAEMERLAVDKGEGVGIRHFLAKVLRSWDLMVEEGGEALGTNEESLRRVPTVITGAVFRAVTEDMRPGEAKSSSGAG